MQYPTCDADVEDASPSGAEVTVHVRDVNYIQHGPMPANCIPGDMVQHRYEAMTLDEWHVLRVHRSAVPWIWSR